MLGWLWRVLVGNFISCQHNWDTFERVSVYGGLSNEIPTAHDFYLRCKNCGNVKRKRL
jgi:hypothetical protein